VVIVDQKPSFTTISEILRISTERTRELLRRELEIKLQELNARWHMLSLEKIFIEKKVYQKIENCETWESVLATIAKGLAPHVKHLVEPVTPDDCAKLTEIKIKRISKFDSRSADDELRKIEEVTAETRNHLAHLTAYAVSWFQNLKKKYGKGRERRTELTTFSAIAAARVAHANTKLFVNKKDGFIGWGLKRDEAAELLSECSDLDDVMAIARDGSLKVNKVAEKEFFGHDLQYVTIFRRGDVSTTYNVIYEHKESGTIFAKRFHMGDGVVRDRVYPVAGGKILYLNVCATPEETPKVVVTLKDGAGVRKREVEFDFAMLAVKNRGSQGNTVTKGKVQKIVKWK
jgi:topoisomerase IV subunit A